MDLFDYATEILEEGLEDVPQEPPVLTVSQLSNTLKNAVEAVFANVRVEGEISGFKRATSGHMYFNLKDEQSVLNAIIWRGSASQLVVYPEEGQQVIAHGRLTTYPARSNYQMIITKLELAGQGNLLQQLEALKKKLQAEGLFDEAGKRPLPYLPRKIGIITSPTGAVIEDMLHRIQDRCPRDIMLCGVSVQGTEAPQQIVKAIQTFNGLPQSEQPDVLIIARGGGSLEDLMAFNDEAVVRAIAASDIPTISGVGHEPDTTLADFAADRRAPTPSAAAEMAVPVKADLLAYLQKQEERLPQALRAKVLRAKERLNLMAKTLPDPRRDITQKRMLLEDRAERLQRAIKQLISTKKQHINHQLSSLNQLSPTQITARGFIFATDAQGQIVRSAKTEAKNVTLHFNDGERQAELV